VTAAGRAGGLGLLGGTFDPIHLGHLRVAEELGRDLDLAKVRLIPAADPPHKSVRRLAPFQDRLAMARLAARGNDLLEVSDIEGRLGGPSYTVNTLRALRRELSAPTRLMFLVGFDSFRNVEYWHGCRELFGLASFVVFARDRRQDGPEELSALLARVLGAPFRTDPATGALVHPDPAILPVHHRRLSMPLDISSTSLRGRLRRGRSVRYVIPDAVLEYIRERRLYTLGPTALGFGGHDDEDDGGHDGGHNGGDDGGDDG
jgi:nicotinate-nucleotide adenylyltransferase